VAGAPVVVTAPLHEASAAYGRGDARPSNCQWVCWRPCWVPSRRGY